MAADRRVRACFLTTATFGHYFNGQVQKAIERGSTLLIEFLHPANEVEAFISKVFIPLRTPIPAIAAFSGQPARLKPSDLELVLPICERADSV